MIGGTEPAHVRAAGGVVWRRRDDGRLEVLLVHRPRYDDWSIPKGKADQGESDEDCARREVEEETGLRCEIAEHLGDVAYLDRHGRHKVARYWAMRPVAGEFVPSREVDEVRWLPVPDAIELLTYQRDAAVLQALGDGRAPPTSGG
ncbi:MAG: NUDIX hydrolase [Actinobacteria bacterium]|nr:NUDIX hydrolase [Actinomycetota bacterium]